MHLRGLEFDPAEIPNVLKPPFSALVNYPVRKEAYYRPTTGHQLMFLTNKLH